jgi:hypothetical protein
MSAMLLGMLLHTIIPIFKADKADPVLEAIIGFFIITLLIPIAQWLIIRCFFPKAIEWLILSLLGQVLGLLVALSLDRLGIYPSQGVFRSVLMPTLYGAIIGFVQWWFLRSYVHHASLWVVASGSGWFLTYAITGGQVVGITGILIFSALPSIIPGLLFAYMSSNRIQNNSLNMVAG